MNEKYCVRKFWLASLPAAFLAAGLAAPNDASAFGMMEVGDWQFQFSGNVNGYLTSRECENKSGGGTIAGGLACGSNGNNRDVNNVRTGLLPSWFGFHAEREENGLKTGVTLGFQPGIDSNTGIAGAPIDGGLGLNSANFRQVFLTFGADSWGTIKVGRDLGIYGSDAILGDMTLLGMGTVSDLAEAGGNTTLGRIGVGYLYADWKGQIQYTSPKYNDQFSFTVALVDPWGLVNLSGESLNAATFNQTGDTFGIEGKVNFEWKGSVPGSAWASFISQSIDSSTMASEDAFGFDIGAKVNFSGFELLGYFYSGEAIGTTDFLFDAVDSTGRARDSDGGYIQGTYKLPGAGTKFGISFGESNLDRGPGDLATSNLVKTNESIVLGVYHPLTSALNLVLEYTGTEATAHNGNKAEESVLAIGAIFFF